MFLRKAWIHFSVSTISVPAILTKCLVTCIRRWLTKKRDLTNEQLVNTHTHTHKTHKDTRIRTHTHTHTHIRTQTQTCMRTHILIYIFTNLISTSIHGTRKKKRKKNRQEQEIKVSRITARGKKIFRSKRKKRPISSDPLKKNQGIRSQLVKKKLKLRWNFSRRFPTHDLS